MLFYTLFSLLLLAWLVIEREIYFSTESVKADGITLSGGYRHLESKDTLRALFFLFFINLAFFGTGNIASVSSFSLEAVYRFSTSFIPALMGSLLILKLLIPFVILSGIFGVLTKSLNLPPFSLFMVVLATTDIMTLNFFFFVVDEGSWLEIGASISHFVISSAFIIFMALLYLLSNFLVRHVIFYGSNKTE